MKLWRPTVIISLFILINIIITAEAVIAAPPIQQAELAFITSPDNNEIIRGIISIRGSASHPGFDRFQVAYAKEPITSNNAWVTIGIERRDQVVNGELAIWDTRTVPDGSYSLRLRVIRIDGNYSEIETKQLVVANTQPTETPTPEIRGTFTPTVTPTPLPPTPTIVIEQPIVATPTPRLLALAGELPTPRPTNSGTIPLPNVEVDMALLRSGCLWGGGGMLFIFLFFGFLSAMQTFVQGFADRTRGRKRRR